MALATVAAAVAVPLAGCGGQRQDAHEPSGTYTVNVVRQSFPVRQNLAHTSDLVLVVRNDSNKTVPNMAVSVDSFSSPSAQPDLANPARPVWIVDVGPGPAPVRGVEGNGTDYPGGAVTAYVNTWAVGAVPPHATRRFVWKVTAVKPGLHRVTYTVAAGLNGKARAVDANGQPVRGSFTVAIASAPAQVHVDPNTGKVVPGPPPLSGA